MATWGSQTWGFSNWGTLGDTTVELTSGVQLNSQEGNLVQESVPGWGTQYWSAGEWGDLKSPEVAVTGQELTSATQAVTAFTDVTVEPTGQQLGPIIIGDYVEGISVETDPLGQELNLTLNSVFAGELVTVQVTSASNEAWGENAWSDGGWGVGDGQTVSVGDTSVAIGQQIDAQGEELTVTVNDVLAGISVLAEPTSITLTPSLGSLSFESKYSIGSAQADTAVGTASGLANADVDVTGQSLSIAEGVVDPAPDAMVEGIGISISVGTGTVTAFANTDITGNEISSTVDNVTTIGNANIDVTGQSLSIAEGVVDPAPDAMVTGIGMTITSGVGTVTAFANTDITGSEVTTEIGDPTLIGTANVDVIGQELTGSTGQLEYEVTYSFDGSEATATAGDVFGGELVTVQVSTASAQPWGETAWGDGQWGQSVGTDIGIGGEEVAVPSVEVDVTGIELSSNTGNESVTGDANIPLTGIALDIQQGDEDAFTNVRINVSGNSIGTIVIGDYLAGISAEAQPSGVTGTTSTGIIGVNAWELVDPGTSPTWSVVDKAA
jgi:hypothetical protein